MDDADFKQLVERLEQESEDAPGAYRVKVAGLALLGFGILALLLAAIGGGLAGIVALVAFLALKGGSALVLLAKAGKAIFLLAVPLWYMGKSAIRALLIRLPVPEGREIRRGEAPVLFEGLDRMRKRMNGPAFHHVLLVNEVNAAVVQRPAWGLVGWPRNYLLLGLPLLECMPPREAFAVVAHEYGHLAGSHGRFSAFIYRLRTTWGTIQDFTEQVEGWLGKAVAPLVRWYAPYFNAYTFVLARTNEYEADAASARLVGKDNAAHALKRVNVASSRHDRFMELTFERIRHEPQPPADLMHRWAAHLDQPAPAADASLWLQKALDRQASVWDTHPTLRARLAALGVTADAIDLPPPETDESAARAWFGKRLELLRKQLQSEWVQRVQEPWAERHEAAKQQVERLAGLRRQATRSSDEELEMLRLALRFEPEQDWREALAAFNAENGDHPLGLFTEATARLEKGDRDGLKLLDRVMELDEDAIKPACDVAYGFLKERGEHDVADVYLQRWKRRDEKETRHHKALSNVDPKHPVVPHGLEDKVADAIRATIASLDHEHVKAIYLGRRVLPGSEKMTQLLLAVELTWWGQYRDQQGAVVNRLAEIEWPVELMIISLDHQYKPMKKKFRALGGEGLVHG
ncbi:MAG TPA: M48 family metalloprotease [Ramlibacter sp.]|uniref:M48 family metalloprotease n=1 Tax=Ramlibacter sp. TaxID=1917967 RepID=UPI002ED30F5A